ncbi:hypothetical protein JVT61DRAFT_9538 [Boletus reticuloceps]|uniref:Uncharacterized protein n=1 Tax=Boletus reticuloceps TaxID=495285 RepID=A0A8I2YGB6_9AGAM|nr:hypothetical protein JVT61DRAFT_9538 [Boletus reticuloceps]
MVVDLSKFATWLVLSERKDPKVMISKDYTSFTVGTQTMSLGKPREGLQELINQVWKRYRAIIQSEPVVKGDLQAIDDSSNDLRGYSFLDEKLFCERRWTMFYRLVQQYDLANVDSHGILCWDVPQVKLLLEKCERLWDCMLHLLFITLGISTQVAQFVRLQVRNGNQQSNLQFWNGEMYFSTRDGKTSSTSGKDSCIPSFLPSQVASILLELIGGGLR